MLWQSSGGRGGFWVEGTLKFCRIQSGHADKSHPTFKVEHFFLAPSHSALLRLIHCSSGQTLTLFTMASENPSDPAASDAAAPQTLPDRTQTPADNQAGESKSAAKKAAKMAKMAADKAEKANKGASKQEPKKAPKKKIEGAALIGIDADKDTPSSFSDWYAQCVTKGDLLDCMLYTNLHSLCRC